MVPSFIGNGAGKGLLTSKVVSSTLDKTSAFVGRRKLQKKKKDDPETVN
jgi:hypothetical protein